MRILLPAILSLVLAGCGVELLTTTAIQGELQAQQVTAMKGQINSAADTSAKINIQRAIDTFMAENGRYPGTLEELVPNHLPSLPTQPDGSPYAYDPASGRLVDGSARNAILTVTAGDRAKMKQITQAVDSYGRATGYYPPSLDALVPGYISAIPKTDSGKDFIFHPEDGKLVHPDQGDQPAAPAAGTPRRLNPSVGGAGPMGEVVTGMGMQQQLNNMSNAGTSSAASYARGRAGRAAQQQQQQQEQALQQLGY